VSFCFWSEERDSFDEVVVEVNVESSGVFFVMVFFSKHFEKESLDEADSDFFVDGFPFIVEVNLEKAVEEFDVSVEIT